MCCTDMHVLTVTSLRCQTSRILLYAHYRHICMILASLQLIFPQIFIKSHVFIISQLNKIKTIVSLYRKRTFDSEDGTVVEKKRKKEAKTTLSDFSAWWQRAVCAEIVHMRVWFGHTCTVITWSAIGQGGNLQETLHVDGVKNWVGIWRYRMRFQITNKTAKLSQNWQVCSLALSMLGDTHMSYINNHEVPLWWCSH